MIKPKSIKPMRTAKIGYIVMSVIFCILGIGLIIYPEKSVSVLGAVMGVVMIIFGIVKIVGYFSKDLLLVDANLSSKSVRFMIDEMEQVDGVKYVLGLESVVGTRVPEEILPESILEILKSDKWELLLINSEYKVASDKVNKQIESLKGILKKYDQSGMLIGEAPCMKDMIETTDHDFQVINAVSIIAIFFIIALVEKSISLPFILISVIEFAIFINLGLPHYFGQSLPFIAPICISTIQLGATVDYAILMTTRYKAERIGGADTLRF